jgi:uncharacterized protein
VTEEHGPQAAGLGPIVRVWRRRDGSTIEHCQLREAADDASTERSEREGPQLDGAVVGTLDGRPLRAEYTVACAADWRTRFVEVVVAHGADVRRLELATDGDGRWWRDGAEVPALAGCLDVDVSVTPSTNTLPIRRLALAVGEARDVTAAWVRVPSLDLEPLPQRYTRLDERRWRYESARGAFVAELDVDDAGLVVRYGELWEAVSE